MSEIKPMKKMVLKNLIGADGLTPLGRLIRRSRSLHDMSQEDLGFQAGVSKTYISRLERGLAEPTEEFLLGLADSGLPVSFRDLSDCLERQGYQLTLEKIR